MSNRTRLIINNDSDLDMEEVLFYVAHVVRGKRVSEEGKMYAYVTTFLRPNDRLVVCATRRTDNSDTFLVYKEELAPGGN